MRISTRIFLGFGLLIILMMSIMLLGQYNNGNIQSKTQTFSELSELLKYINDLEREVVEMEMSVMVFSQTGHPAVINKVRESDTKISKLSEIISKGVENSKYAELFLKIKAFRKNYIEVFERFITDRKNRDELYAKSKGLAEDMIKTMELQKSDDTGYLLAKNAFYKTEKLMADYLEEPDSSIVRGFNQQLILVKDFWETKKHTELMASLEDYSKNFNALVQTIRGYLFLSNVVLAGQAAEFKYNSELFRDQFNEDEKNTLKELSENSQYYSNIELFFAVILIGLGIIISYSVSKTIAGPISKITDTLVELSKGEKVVTIPGLEKSDEIGEMAKAAEVFKEKNQETENLLKKSKEAEEQLQQQTLELARANSELEQFAYVASHDLQEPLRMVASYVQLLAQEYEEKLDEDAKEYIGFASEGAKRMQLLINDLLDLSRVGRTETQFEMVDSQAVFDMVCQEVRVMIEENRAKIIAHDLPEVRAIPRLLQQVMQNFLINALKYRKKETEVVFEVHAETKEDGWLFSFRDNGIGIDPRHFDRIFLIFQRLHSRKEFPGSGVGLALVKKIAEQHQGKVWVESSPGEGSTFYFLIGKV